MAKLFESITEELQEFITAQHLFFVGTAPLSSTGHVNLSPKGLDCFRILSPHRVGYLDLTGSGNETSAHLQENGRITFLFCAFTDTPLILRLYGKGCVILPNSPDWDSTYSLFTQLPGTRQIIVADIERVQTSCGFGVPMYEYQGQRQILVDWASKKGEEGVREYQQKKNLMSIDGLPTPVSQLFEAEELVSSETRET
ncbi:pyridoxamine 5'-phosphate oxidase family protein [Nostoc sp. FACHB-152]|uniref:pyridoxamine 5'-phosphate oxidase family protein n=1 Tax=unclassified Nostoc TaxID=2593658 RepID=UPI0016863AA9|nr:MULTISPECIES: pyridoxamine 5'-phosphate oxidase family protein [unclassified Nostoc]MBD2449368.1 pyridoxamine 5'-phosphate oxidase family protein [Nostoc sp. FACHB-152]MBD2472947.1 pyridoxamine 5'-phosphate oxidase family protein [Nostoc sp. FACHB-145]